jgi:hypothetical protein
VQLGAGEDEALDRIATRHPFDRLRLVLRRGAALEPVDEVLNGLLVFVIREDETHSRAVEDAASHGARGGQQERVAASGAHLALDQRGKPDDPGQQRPGDQVEDRVDGEAADDDPLGPGCPEGAQAGGAPGGDGRPRLPLPGDRLGAVGKVGIGEQQHPGRLALRPVAGAAHPVHGAKELGRGQGAQAAEHAPEGALTGQRA